MRVANFKASLSAVAPPTELTTPLIALWWAGKGDWKKAHEIAQDEYGPEAAWAHAYLHRVEGDLGNAGHWYRQAGQPLASDHLDDEWERIVATLLQGAQT